jgi:hypothetical protein
MHLSSPLKILEDMLQNIESYKRSKRYTKNPECSGYNRQR